MHSWLLLLALSLLPCALEDGGPPTLTSKTLVECETKVVRLAANEKGQLLLLATEQGDVCAWNVGKKAFSWKNGPGLLLNREPATSELHVAYLRALDVGEKVAFIGRGIPVPSTLELATGKETEGYVMAVPDPSQQIVGLRCDANDRWGWMALTNGALVRYVPNGGKAYTTCRLKDLQLTSFTYDSDASLLAAGGADGTIRFANGSSARADDDKVFRGPKTTLNALAFANRGALLLAADDEGDVTIWNVGTGKVRQTVHASEAALRHVLVHPKNKWFVTASKTGVPQVWSLDKGELLATLGAEGEIQVHALAFIEGGKSLAGALGGKNVVVWDVSKL